MKMMNIFQIKTDVTNHNNKLNRDTFWKNRFIRLHEIYKDRIQTHTHTHTYTTFPKQSLQYSHFKQHC